MHMDENESWVLYPVSAKGLNPQEITIAEILKGADLPLLQIPYNALIVPFSYFFYHHKKNPTGPMKNRLEDYFWRVSLGFRYKLHKLKL